MFMSVLNYFHKKAILVHPLINKHTHMNTLKQNAVKYTQKYI